MTSREKFIILLNNDKIYPSDAIILLEGDGFNRIERTVELYNLGFSKTVVFSGGIHKPENGSFPSETILPLLINKGVLSDNIIIESKSLNTFEQALEISHLAKKHTWKKIILVASHYHQYRAFLTFLKVIKNNAQNLLLFNGSANDLNWFEETGWGKRFDLLDQEFEKIDDYAQKGHIETYEQGIEYLKWKEKFLLNN